MPLYKVHGPCRICKEGQGTEWGGYCYDCFHEKAMIQNHCRRSRKAELPCDLTQEQWRDIIKTFNGLCAYCLEQPYQELDHFIPKASGGGTTITNCVPSCRVCNMRKYDKRPDDVTRIPKEALKRVHEYLESLEKG